MSTLLWILLIIFIFIGLPFISSIVKSHKELKKIPLHEYFQSFISILNQELFFNQAEIKPVSYNKVLLQKRAFPVTLFIWLNANTLFIEVYFTIIPHKYKFTYKYPYALNMPPQTQIKIAYDLSKKVQDKFSELANVQ